MQNEETQLLARYRQLVEVTRDIASVLSLDLLLNRIAVAAAQLTASEAASILLYDAERDLLSFQEASNFERPFIRGLVVPVEDSIAGWVVRSGEPVIVDDPSSDPRFYAEIQKWTHVETHSLLAAPLLTQGRIVGVLEAINKEGGTFSTEDQDILVALGTQAAIAIENARLFARSDLITEIVHELRTPMTSINAAANLLARPELPAEQRTSITKMIQEESRRLTEMATRFLDLARLEAGQMAFTLSQISLNELIEDCTLSIRGSVEEKRIRLTIDIPEGLPPITGDSSRLHQVFTNLLSNAVKFNVVGGTVTIRARREVEGTAVTIADTGRGIPPEDVEHLFQKFYRAPGTENTTRGTGLGLHIVSRIVHAHGGRIEVDSTPGQGSAFTVHLPLHRD